MGSISSPRQGETSIKSGSIQALLLGAAGDGDGDRAGDEATCNIRPRSRQKSGLMACMPTVWPGLSLMLVVTEQGATAVTCKGWWRGSEEKEYGQVT